MSEADRLRTLGHQLIDRLADFLATSEQGAAVPVLPWVDPDVMLRRWPAEFADAGGADFDALIERVLSAAIRLHHPRYIGHQVSAPIAEAALSDLVASVLNNGMAVYEMGQATTAMETSLLGWLAARLGMPAGAGGVLTSGGSAGNLTALLAAREASVDGAWDRGGAGYAVLVAESAHYSVARAAQVMGLGREGVLRVPVDERFRMRADALETRLADVRRSGRTPIAVVASAGSTSTGAYDPLPAIADVCARERVWLHVDGAHGACAAMAPELRHLVDGIERADSVVWDMHKMLLVPALVTAVIFRDGRQAYGAFAQKAEYLFADGAEPWWDIGLRTLECTKKMLVLKVWAALACRGPGAIGAYVADTFVRTRAFAARLRAAGDFEAIEPDANILCFRWVGPSGVPDDGVQERVRARLVESGAFYLVKTRLPSGVWLRITLINPATTDADLDALADAVRRVATAP